VECLIHHNVALGKTSTGKTSTLRLYRSTYLGFGQIEISQNALRSESQILTVAPGDDELIGRVVTLIVVLNCQKIPSR
jgi:hypothetical protein